MPKEEWGTKRVCPTTGKRFYDLNRDPVVSPYTGEVVSLDTGTKSRTLISDKGKAKAKPETETDEESAVIDDEDEASVDVDVDVDDDLLEEDDEGNVSLDDLADVSSDDDDN